KQLHTKTADSLFVAVPFVFSCFCGPLTRGSQRTAGQRRDAPRSLRDGKPINAKTQGTPRLTRGRAYLLIRRPDWHANHEQVVALLGVMALSPCLPCSADRRKLPGAVVCGTPARTMNHSPGFGCQSRDFCRVGRRAC